MNNDTIREQESPAARTRTAGLLALIVILLVLIADQTLKIWVKTHFYLGEDLEITPWWHLKFIENNGMAFGIELWSKVFLTLFRMIAVGLLIWIVVKLSKHPDTRRGFMVAVALVTAGAAGNIFDCLLYGVIFDNPYPPTVATLFPPDGGYSTWFEGRVVDMLYFPLFTFDWPQWMPIVGGENYEFFAYIFNIADASICVGVAMLLIFYGNDVATAWQRLTAKPTDQSKRNRTK